MPHHLLHQFLLLDFLLDFLLLLLLLLDFLLLESQLDFLLLLLDVLIGSKLSGTRSPRFRVRWQSCFVASRNWRRPGLRAEQAG